MMCSVFELERKEIDTILQRTTSTEATTRPLGKPLI